jgi:hypothetical protein
MKGLKVMVSLAFNSKLMVAIKGISQSFYFQSSVCPTATSELLSVTVVFETEIL